jgi:hypothetical protein
VIALGIRLGYLDGPSMANREHRRVVRGSLDGSGPAIGPAKTSREPNDAAINPNRRIA